jgi:hypothetical protein
VKFDKGSNAMNVFTCVLIILCYDCVKTHKGMCLWRVDLREEKKGSWTRQDKAVACCLFKGRCYIRQDKTRR